MLGDRNHTRASWAKVRTTARMQQTLRLSCTHVHASDKPEEQKIAEKAFAA